jgi:hypothetical protein
VRRRRRLLLRDAVNVAAAEHDVARGHGDNAARGEDGLQLRRMGEEVGGEKVGEGEGRGRRGRRG